MSVQQLMAKMMQLQKVCNHPKCVLFQFDRDQAKAKSFAKRAEGSEFVKVPTTTMEDMVLGKEGGSSGGAPLSLSPPSSSSLWSSLSLAVELRGLQGDRLLRSSGKLALLDRLVRRSRAEGSRLLVFSQYTLTLDVLEEYCEAAVGPRGRAYLRLDGATNRILREMDVNAFNAPGSGCLVYLISTRAGGQGINLASADVVVLFDTCWYTCACACARTGTRCIHTCTRTRAHRVCTRTRTRIHTRTRMHGGTRTRMRTGGECSGARAP